MDQPITTTRRRTGMPAANVLVVLLVCLLAWGLLYSPELLRSAKTHPDGVRRDVSVAILSPVAWLANVTGLGAVTDAAARAAGRDPDAELGGIVGGVEVNVDDLPSFNPKPEFSGRPPIPPVRNTRLRKPTNAQKLRVVVVGDSLAAGIGYFAERVFKPFFVDVVKQGRISTGLARPDYFDWQRQMQVIVDRYRPDLTIVMVGENDNQALRNAAGREETPVGTFDWPRAYAERVEDFMRLATSKGARVVWVGLPIVSDEGRWGIVERQNTVFDRSAAAFNDVTYLDTWDMFESPDGGYTAYYRSDGEVELIRESDGLHFNAAGYELLARAVVEAAQEEFGLTPRVLAD